MRLKTGFRTAVLTCLGIFQLFTLYTPGWTQAIPNNSWLSNRTFPLTQALQAPLKVYVEPHPQPASLYRPHYAQYVREGLNAWANALNGRLTYQMVSDPQSAQIRVGWVPAFQDKTQAGCTIYGYGQNQIQIKTPGIPDKDIKANIMHEIGHALGIVGHSHSQNDIMTAVRRWHSGKSAASYHPVLSAKDRQAINRLYSTKWQPGEDLYSSQTASRNIINPTSYRTSDSGAILRR